MTILMHPINMVSLSLFGTASRDVLTWWERIENENKMKNLFRGSCCSVKVLAIVTAALLVVFIGVLVLSFYGIPKIVQSQVDKSVRLTEDTDQWDRFLELPIPIITKIFLYNVDNAADVINGAKAKVTEVGPYIFSQKLTKNILSTDEDEDTVTYQKYTQQTFEPTLSGKLTLNDYVMVLNPVYLVLTQVTSSLEQMVVQGCLDKIFAPQYNHLFINTTVEKLIFKGFKFAELSDDVGYSCNVVRSQVIDKTLKMKNIQRIYSKDYPGVIESLKFSLMGFKIEAPDGIYTVNRGIDDITKLGSITQWNHSTHLPFWGRTQSINNESCQIVNGGDSTIYPPHVHKEKNFKIFSTDICRSVEIFYTGEGSYKGIDGLRFEPNKDVFRSKTSNPEEDCFCTQRTLNPQGKPDCYLNGVVDVYDCFGVPLLLSLPHFLYADESYRNGLIGIDPPDPAIHGIYLLVEPNTGTPLQGKKRVQLNLVLRPSKIDATKKLLPTVMPILWLEEGADLTDDLVDFLNSKYFNVVKLATGLKYGLIAVSAAAVLVTIVILIRKKI